MRKVLLGAVLMLVLLLLSAVAVIGLGLLPVSADGSHSNIEARLMPRVLRIAVARQASGIANPIAVNEDSLLAGAHAYRTMCATCHSTPTGGPSVYGQAFYPPAPQLSGGLPQYTDSEIFWIIKHGIRNTGMPAWGQMLSDEEIWQIVTVLKSDNDRYLR